MIWEVPQGNPQIFVSFVILDPVKFTTKANHHRKHRKYISEGVFVYNKTLFTHRCRARFVRGLSLADLWPVAGWLNWVPDRLGFSQREWGFRVWRRDTDLVKQLPE